MMKNGLILLLLGTAAMTWGAGTYTDAKTVAVQVFSSDRPVSNLSKATVDVVGRPWIHLPAIPCLPVFPYPPRTSVPRF